MFLSTNLDTSLIPSTSRLFTAISINPAHSNENLHKAGHEVPSDFKHHADAVCSEFDISYKAGCKTSHSVRTHSVSIEVST
jgi:hypothetical protein